MNPRAIMAIIAIIILATTTVNAVHFDLTKLVQKQPSYQLKYKLVPIGQTIDLTYLHLPYVGVQLNQNELASHCQTRRPANDVFIINCQGQAAFNVNLQNINPINQQSVMATLVLTNTQTGNTLRVPLGFVRSGDNQKQFSAGDLTNFDQWNVRVCVGQLCSIARQPGTMVCNEAAQSA